MVKILIIGEAHNSVLAPKMALKSLEILRQNHVRVIAASEDEAGLQAPIDLFEYVKTMNLLKGELEKANPALATKLFTGEEFSLTVRENNALRDFFKKGEIIEILDKFEKEVADNIKSPGGCGFFIDAICGLEPLIASFGGIERMESYAALCKGFLEQGIKPIALEDKSKTMPRYLELKNKVSEGEIAEEEALEMEAILKDPAIDQARVNMMSDSVMMQVSNLKEDRNAIILIYPFGMFHANALSEVLRVRSAEMGVEIYSHNFLDSREQLGEVLRSDPAQEEVIKSLPNLYFLSAQEDKAKYFAELEKFIGTKSPDSVPKPAAAAALVAHDKVATL